MVVDLSRGTSPEVRLAVSDQGHGRPVLFQHGLCGDARQPAEVFPLDRFRCITVECRGHGGSEVGDPTRFGLATFAQDVAGAIAARQLARLPVGGISMGAALAAWLAVKHPSSVSALVLARPAWVVDAAPVSMAANALVGSLLARYGPAEGQARFDASDTAADLARRAPDNLASLRGFFGREPAEVTAALLTRIAADGPGVTRDDLRGLAVPTLVIGHDRDVIHPLAMAEELAGLIPGARLVVIPAKADGVEPYRAAFRTALGAFLDEVAG